jgi:hypothetical protein
LVHSLFYFRWIFGLRQTLRVCKSIVPLMAAEGLVTFSLDEKVTKKSSQKKASTLQAILPARFSDRPLPTFDFVAKTFSLCLKFSSPSAGELRAKSDKTMVDLSVGRGIANFLHKRSATKKGKPAKKIAARGFILFAGQRLVRQRSISAESLFGYFCGDKSN